MKRYTIPGVLFCLLLAGCGAGRDLSPGGREMEERQLIDDPHILTLADLQDYQDSMDEGLQASAGHSGFATQQAGKTALPFTMHHLWLSSAGGSQSFISVSLPDTVADNAAATIAAQYMTAATSLLHQWAAAQTGVLLDLRSDDGALHQQTFTVTSDKLHFPVIVVWDDAGAPRAEAYLQLLRSLPGAAAATTLALQTADLPPLPGATRHRSLLEER